MFNQNIFYMKKSLFFVFALALVTTCVHAQKLKVVSGTADFLKGQKDVAVIYTYETLKVGKMEEPAYIEREIGEREKKEAGTGEKWKEAWKKDQQERYPLKWVELFNKVAGDRFDCSVKQDAADSKYTIKVNTTFIEPGYNVGVSRMPAYVDQTVTIYETANPEVILSEITITRSPGADAMGFDFDSGFRIGEAFAKAAKEYANILYKTYYK